MTGDERLQVSAGTAAATIVLVLLAGAGGTYVLMRGSPPRSSQGVTPAAADGPPSTGAPAAPTPREPVPPASVQRAGTALPDVVVTLAPDAAHRAEIRVTRVSTEAMTDGLRVPGVVQPNAYRQVSVTPLVAGRVVRVSAQLGDRVKRGQPIAQLYSPELAEARTKYIAARAMLDAHDRELQRTQKLVEIGAASRQELERLHAEHAAQTAEVESARSRLQLLGADVDDASPAKAEATASTDVPAPIDGVVTERLANVGQNVDPTTRLFTVVDLSTLWIIADVYERDLHLVREGSLATVTTPAPSNLSLSGRISYIDPQLNTDTRTAKLRVEVANPRGDLRIGMYTDVTIAAAAAAATVSIPTSSVQSIGDHHVVYLPVPHEASAFTEHEVRLGRSSGGQVEVVSGLKTGDSVVSNGSFFVRAEIERLGLRASPARSAAERRAASGTTLSGADAGARVLVSEKGYEPARLTVQAGVPARITFLRTTDKTCGTEVVFPSLNIKRALPLDEPVTIEFTPAKAGEVAFVCGMNMLKGVVVVQ